MPKTYPSFLPIAWVPNLCALWLAPAPSVGAPSEIPVQKCFSRTASSAAPPYSIQLAVAEEKRPDRMKKVGFVEWARPARLQPGYSAILLSLKRFGGIEIGSDRGIRSGLDGREAPNHRRRAVVLGGPQGCYSLFETLLLLSPSPFIHREVVAM